MKCYLLNFDLCDLELCQTLLKYDFCTSSRQGEYLTQASKKIFQGVRKIWSGQEKLTDD